MDMTELRRQHDDISYAARRLAEATADPRRPQSVAAIRWQLARHLMGHLALEDRIFYPALHRADDPLIRKSAAMLQSETGALADIFTRYMSAWSDDRIAREWSAFCAETRDILKALVARVERENRILYPLADTIDPNAASRTRAG